MFKKYQSQITYNLKNQLQKNLFISATKKSFSGANPVVNLNIGNNVTRNPENDIVLSKLVEKDVSYFSKLLNQKGAEYTLQRLENVSAGVDASTKSGREILKTKNEIVTRLVYQERSVEEHENVSNHISEADLYKVYAEHMKQLDGRLQNVDYLKSKSKEGAQLIYQDKGLWLNSKYFLSPFLMFTVPSVFVWKYSLVIANAFGALSPSLLTFVALYTALRRYKWLTAGSKILGAKLVSSLKLVDNALIVQTQKNNPTRLSLSSVNVQLVESDLRRDSYYVIRDTSNNNLYIMPIEEGIVIDHKTLNSLSQFKNSNDEYSIKEVLANGTRKLIDINKTKLIKQEMDTLARINILSSRVGDITQFNASQLNEKLNSIADAEVSEYLENARRGISSSLPSLESNLVNVENLLASLGLIRDEAVAMTQSLRKNYLINGVSDLSTMNKTELKEAFDESVSKSELKFDDLYRNIEAFFKSLETK